MARALSSARLWPLCPPSRLPLHTRLQRSLRRHQTLPFYYRSANKLNQVIADGDRENLSMDGNIHVQTKAYTVHCSRIATLQPAGGAVMTGSSKSGVSTPLYLALPSFFHSRDWYEKAGRKVIHPYMSTRNATPLSCWRYVSLRLYHSDSFKLCPLSESVWPPLPPITRYPYTVFQNQELRLDA